MQTYHIGINYGATFPLDAQNIDNLRKRLAKEYVTKSNYVHVSVIRKNGHKERIGSIFRMNDAPFIGIHDTPLCWQTQDGKIYRVSDKTGKLLDYSKDRKYL